MHARGADRGEDLYKQGGSVWLGRGGGSSGRYFWREQGVKNYR